MNDSLQKVTEGLRYLPEQAPWSFSGHKGEGMEGVHGRVRKTVSAEERDLRRDCTVQSRPLARTHHMDSDEWKRAEVCPGA